MKKHLLLLVLLGSFLNVISAQMKKPTNGETVSKNQSDWQLKIVHFRAQSNDLAYLRAVNLTSGAVFRVYFDEISKPEAEKAVPVLAQLYEEVASLTVADAGKVNWAAVVFSTDENYVPPRNEGEVRWKIRVDKNGKLGAQGIKDLYQIIPHEQTHALESTFIPKSPRWFSEGLASWVEANILKKWQPELARQWREESAVERAKVTVPLNLKGWGGVSVKREAILRQVTSEVRARMEKDPTFMPPGPFKLQPGDFLSDESNTAARYAEALNLFIKLDERAGRQKFQNFLKGIWEQISELNTDEIAARINKQLNMDISDSLK